jgi:hypothetical protein
VFRPVRCYRRDTGLPSSGERFDTLQQHRVYCILGAIRCIPLSQRMSHRVQDHQPAATLHVSHVQALRVMGDACDVHVHVMCVPVV